MAPIIRESVYFQNSTLMVYVPCWAFADFCGFVEVLRDHHNKLRIRVGAIIWVDGKEVIEMLKGVEKEKENLTFEAEDL